MVYSDIVIFSCFSNLTLRHLLLFLYCLTLYFNIVCSFKSIKMMKMLKTMKTIF